MIQFLPFVGKILDKVIPDKEKAAAAKIKLFELEQAGDLKELESAAQIITAEAKSEHPLTSQWRPITMLVFVVIIANNYILAPYIALFTGTDVTLDLPPDMWDLLKIGLGGYVIGRSAEKGVQAWKSSK